MTRDARLLVGTQGQPKEEWRQLTIGDTSGHLFLGDSAKPIPSSRAVISTAPVNEAVPASPKMIKGEKGAAPRRSLPEDLARNTGVQLKCLSL